jgi:hypothetical protein
MRIAILAPYLPNTGNTTTAERIAGHLASAGHEVFACTVNATLSIDEFLEYLSKNEIDFAIGLHGFKSGIFLKHSPIPYALIFSNTDLNVDILDPHRAEIMREAAVRARTVVTYNEEFAERIRHCWPELADVRCIHKGIHVRPDPMFSVRAMFGLSPQVSLFVLPAGLRPVKDPLYAVKAFSEWHQRVSNTALLIFGVTRHERYSNKRLSRLTLPPECITAVQ